MTSETIIECQHVASGYDGHPIMNDINLKIQRGEIVFILGASGCGKSTLLKHIIGLVPPVKGSIFIKGMDFTKAEGEMRGHILRLFGVMYQSGALFGTMTLLENVLLPLEEFTTLPETIREGIAKVKLAQVSLLDKSFAYPAELSGGMKKRAAIARAMALDPDVLFLDEPSAGLDPITSAQLDALILRLSRELGMTIVIISHELASIESIADRVIYLDKEAEGVLDEGTPLFLKQNSQHQRIRDFFNRRIAVYPEDLT